MINTLCHIIGYTMGVTQFIILIPFGLFKMAEIDHQILGDMFIHSEILCIIISIPFFIVGAVFMVWSNLFLFKAGKGGPTDVFNFSVSPRTKKLVITGPYRFSRNPMVLGALSLYTSLAIYQYSVFCLIIIMLLIFLVIIYLKKTEEKRLLSDFGQEYQAYKSKVSMIVPIKRWK